MDLPRDTSLDAQRVQRAIFRGMTGSERVAMAFEMSDAARSLTEAGIRHRHPDWTDQQVHDALLERLHGPELAGKVRRSRLLPA
jgi:Rv0078B-related antitoxin